MKCVVKTRAPTVRRPSERIREMSAAPPSLRHFVLRAEARKLYREVLRTVRGLDKDTADGVLQAAREQFQMHVHETDVDQIRTLIIDGQHSLDQMKGALGAASPTIRGKRR